MPPGTTSALTSRGAEIRIYLDDCETPELAIDASDLVDGRFNDGKFCFYTYSQVRKQQF